MAKHFSTGDEGAHSDAEIARLRTALAPLAALEVPKKPQGNSGFYSIRFAVIEAAKAAMGYEGCPVCHGDCASANPPVIHCPMKS